MFIEQKVKILEGKVSDQSQEINQLKQKIERIIAEYQQSEMYEKQIYTVKDLSELLGVSEDHARKGYIQKNKVKAEKKSAGYEIKREEYKRVQEIINTRGKHYLLGS